MYTFNLFAQHNFEKSLEIYTKIDAGVCVCVALKIRVGWYGIFQKQYGIEKNALVSLYKHLLHLQAEKHKQTNNLLLAHIIALKEPIYNSAT